MRVKIISLNSVFHDARVLKQAKTLADVGYDVEILGIYDRRAKNNKPDFPSNIRVSLVKILPVAVIDVLLRNARWVSIVAGLLVGLGLFFGSPTKSVLETLLHSSIVIWGAIAVVSVSVWLGIATIAKSRYLHSRLRRWLLSVISIKPRVKGMKTLKKYYDKFRGFCKQCVQNVRVQLHKKSLIREATASPMDVIHCHGFQTLPIGTAIKHKTGVPLIWDVNDTYEELAHGNALHTKQCRAIIEKYQSYVDRFIVSNDGVAAFYEKNHPLLPRATVVRNSVIDVTDDGRLRIATGLPPTQKIVLYQGRFSEKRGLLRIVEAAVHLEPAWTLVIMGWGDGSEDELKTRVVEINRARADRPFPAVCLLPTVKQLEFPYWAAGASVCLTPYENVGSNDDRTPNKLWTYSAAGVPILCSPLIELKEVVENNGIGWLLPCDGFPSVIADAINKLTDEEILEARRNCKKYIANENWNSYGQRIVRVYSELFNKGGERDSEPSCVAILRSAVKIEPIQPPQKLVAAIEKVVTEGTPEVMRPKDFAHETFLPTGMDVLLDDCVPYFKYQYQKDVSGYILHPGRMARFIASSLNSPLLPNIVMKAEKLGFCLPNGGLAWYYPRHYNLARMTGNQLKYSGISQAALLSAFICANKVNNAVPARLANAAFMAMKWPYTHGGINLNDLAILEMPIFNGPPEIILNGWIDALLHIDDYVKLTRDEVASELLTGNLIFLSRVIKNFDCSRLSRYSDTCPYRVKLLNLTSAAEGNVRLLYIPLQPGLDPIVVYPRVADNDSIYENHIIKKSTRGHVEMWVSIGQNYDTWILAAGSALRAQINVGALSPQRSSPGSDGKRIDKNGIPLSDGLMGIRLSKEDGLIAGYPTNFIKNNENFYHVYHVVSLMLLAMRANMAKEVRKELLYWALKWREDMLYLSKTEGLKFRDCQSVLKGINGGIYAPQYSSFDDLLSDACAEYKGYR